MARKLNRIETALSRRKMGYKQKSLANASQSFKFQSLSLPKKDIYATTI